MTIISVNVQTGEITEREMTPDEVAAIPPPPPRNVTSEIDAIERQHMMPRAQREFMLGMMVQLATQQGVSEPQLYAANPGYRKVKDLDEQIKTLRSLL